MPKLSNIFSIDPRKPVKFYHKRYRRQLHLFFKASAKKLKKIQPGLAIGSLLIFVGIALASISLFNTWQHQRAAAQSAIHALQSNSQTNDQVPLISGTPVRIEVPSVGIDLKVIPGYYYQSSQSWTLSLNDAQYAVLTTKPNNRGGDTFIYAHYRLHVFYTLPKVQPGDQAIVTTDNGHVFTYVYRGSIVTAPNDTSLFNYKGKPILVLQTCTGLWFQNRQLFTFDLAGAK